MKRFSKSLFTIIFLTTLLFYSCGNQNPKTTLKNYLEALKVSDYETSYSIVSSPDKNSVTFEEYQTEASNEFGIFTKEFRKKSSFEILSSTINENIATVDAVLTFPDTEALAQIILLSAFSENDTNLDSLNLDTLPFTSENVTFTFVKEENSWKIFFDWATKKKIKALKEKSEESYERKEYEEALILYKELYKIEPSKETKDIIDELEAYIKRLNEKKECLKKVELYDLNARLYDNYFFTVPGVTYKIKNNSDKELTYIEVTVYFQNENGNVISEERFCPVGSNSTPLKPGYIWQQDKNTYTPAYSVADEWKEGKAYAKITDIDFK